MESYQTDIISLISQLEKLMKVINHSDPSAKELKQLLYIKYQKNVADVADQIKGRYLWDDIKEMIHTIFQNNYLEIDDRMVQDKIRNKLLKDFEDEFISKPQWQEFSAPDPMKIQQRIQSRKMKKEQKQNLQNDASVKLSTKQRHAKGELQKLIDAINRLDPQKLEKRITKSAGRNK